MQTNSWIRSHSAGSVPTTYVEHPPDLRHHSSSGRQPDTIISFNLVSLTTL